ncbi:MAG: HD domain-containing protein [Deltaproteobacteria bacterium]|nr:HD domain-containing protein [Deltaproteobacteria bacterium]
MPSASQRPLRAPIRIRDPIHGTIQLAREEIALVDSPAYQRLRMIKQLGLADLAFPGATHTRYAHGLGVLHIATGMFNQLERAYALPAPEAQRLRATVRLAALFHDLGHAPLSHTTEAFMPPVGALGMGRWLEGSPDRRASHEDYTIKILVDSDLTRRIEQHLTPETGVTAEDVAAVIAGWTPDAKLRERFRVQGRDLMPVLRQCVSSELDADRMDYLLRDSYYAGVPYGRYDHEWLLENLLPVERGDRIYLGLDARASFGFEDFLLSRYHMFTSVYFHQIPIGYEVMLTRYFDEAKGELEVPHDVEAYLRCDDIYLWTVLRQSRNPWAKRMIERRAYRMLVEVKQFDQRAEGESEPDLDAVTARLAERGIHALVHSAKGELSKYFKATRPRPSTEDSNPPLYVVDGARSIPIEQYTPLYERYAGAVHLRRLYVDPEQLDAAKRVLSELREAS